jgi:hypothetical protein
MEAFGEPYMVWHDGPDFAEFQSRFAADPELATRMLAAGLAEGDALAAQTPRELTLTAEQRAGFVRMLTHALPGAGAGVRVEGVRDGEYLVRYHSANTLLRWAGRTDDISDDELFALLVDDAGPDGWAVVAERLAAAVKP